MSKLFEVIRKSHDLLTATPQELLALIEEIAEWPNVEKIRIGHRDGIPREMIEIFIEYTPTTEEPAVWQKTSKET